MPWNAPIFYAPPRRPDATTPAHRKDAAMDDDWFTFEVAERLLGNRIQGETTCLKCSASRKPEHRHLRCFGLRRVAPDRIVFNCMNCGLKGVRTRGYGRRRA
jgi:hypothetical protein